MSCPCCGVFALCAIVPSAMRAFAAAPPWARGAATLLAPVALLACAIAAGWVESAGLVAKARCVMECSCARSYAIGGAALWALAVRHAVTVQPLPKDAAGSRPTVDVSKIAKPAAKAA